MPDQSDKRGAMAKHSNDSQGAQCVPHHQDDIENRRFVPSLHSKQILPPAMGTGDRRSGSATSSGIGGRQHKLKQRFTVIRKLGKGTYGKVQLAINKETGQEVAIKTIKKTKIENEQDLERVRREIQIMSSIEHPHIIHIYEVFENKDKIVLIMQYAPGGELYEYVSQSKVLDEFEARRLFRQVATAIYYCHKNKICHRDLKLENILLDEKNNAKLADFGLSNVFDKSRQLKTFCGSPLYASPEIVQGSPYEGPEVDCWSLGVLLYTLVYGAMPFDGSNFKRLVKQISEACYYEPKQKSQASPLISRLLCADPIKRATILDICQDPWVNGHLTVQSLSSPTRPLSPTGPTNQQQAHTSLLKVAQDMANLTPVRLDILLALTPASNNNNNSNNNENDDTAKQQQLANDQKQIIQPATQQPRRGSKMIMDLLDSSSIMEVDENRATSPVASYVVRDLAAESASSKTHVQPQIEQNVVEPMAIVVNEPNAANLSQPDVASETSVINEQQVALDQEATIVQPASGEPELQQQTEDRSDATRVDASATVPDNSGECAEVGAPPQEPANEAELGKVEEAMTTKTDEASKIISEAKRDNSVQQPSVEISTEKSEQKEEAMVVDGATDDANMEIDDSSRAAHQERLEHVMNEEPKDLAAAQSGTVMDAVEASKQSDQPDKVGSMSALPSQPEESSVQPDSTPIGDETAVAAAAADVSTKEEQAKEMAAAEGDENKPKKVKKKIVVVKKKRKVVKKEAGSEADTAEADAKDNKTDRQESGADGSSAPDKSQKSAAATSAGPGKVRIPESFKAPSSSAIGAASNSNNNNNNDQTSSVPAKVARRQSALIADVSQRLLQQQQQQPTPSSREIEVDQPQLASVRVSNKTSEYERRASLNASANNQQATGSLPPKGSQGALPTPQAEPTLAAAAAAPPPQDIVDGQDKKQVPPMNEPQRTTSRRESSKLVAPLGQSIVEPVNKLDPQLTAQPSAISATANKESPSGPITPTGATSGCQLESLAQCLADRLGAGDETGSNLSPATAGSSGGGAADERSDSVETIKAELGGEQPGNVEQLAATTTTTTTGTAGAGRPANVRSSLQISLGGSCAPNQGRQQSASGWQGPQSSSTGTGTGGGDLSAASVGPAPIARSYKKVTFTKDGTCITETGKIYSTQADDGTVRRVERKSRVTHYPSDTDPSMGASTSREETHEEIVYEDSQTGQAGRGLDQLWHSGPRQSFDIGKPGGRPMLARLGNDEHGSDSSSQAGVLYSAQRGGKPFERLIMPSANTYYGDDGDDGEDDFTQQQRQFSGMPTDGMDSASSCSSGSTDVFDDIFDTWTGAISMFSQRNNRLSSLRDSLMNRAFVTGSPLPFGPGSSPSTSVHGRSNRPQSGCIGSFNQQQRAPFHVSSSVSGTPQMGGPRCGSVEPPRSLFDGERYSPSPRMSPNRPHRHHHHHQHHRRHNHHRPNHPSGRSSADASGYESDVPYERPATATLGSARGMFGSSNLFPRHKASGAPGSLFDEPLQAGCDDLFESFGARLDPFGGSLLMQEIELEHEKLRRKMALQRKQLWKGSTPALHEIPVQLHTASASDNIMHQQPPVSQFRSRSGSSSALAPAARPPQSVSPSNFQQQQPQQRRVITTVYKNLQQQQAPSSSSSSSSPMTHLNQSQSSSKLQSIRQSVPLDSAPTRRNTANLAEHLPPRQPLGAVTMRRSTSRTSFIASQMANMQLSEELPSSSNSETIETRSVASQKQQHHQRQQGTVNDDQHRQVAASFIELKRSSSCSQSIQQQQQQHPQQQHQGVTSDSRQEPFGRKAQQSFDGEPPAFAGIKRDLHLQMNPGGCAQQPNSAGSSSAFWEDRMTPTTYSNTATESLGAKPTVNPLAGHESEANSRIQSWLQQSAGNLSISSGSKSSASDTLPSSGRSDIASQASQLLRRYGDEFTTSTTKETAMRLGQQHRLDRPAEAADFEQLMSMIEPQQHRQLPPIPGGSGGLRSPVRQVRVLREPGGATTSTSSMTVRSSSKHSMSGRHAAGDQMTGGEQLVERKLKTLETVVLGGDGKSAEEVFASRSTASNSAQISSQLTFAFPSDDQSPTVRTQKHNKTVSSSTSSKQHVITYRVVSPTQTLMSTAPVTADRDPWLQYQNQTGAALASTAGGLEDLNDDFDSLVGSGAELESQSSSSLLDQLRARGYRSMINQRIVNTQQQQHQQQQQQITQVGDSNVITTSSTSITMSSSGLGVGGGGTGGAHQDEDQIARTVVITNQAQQQKDPTYPRTAAIRPMTHHETCGSTNESPQTSTTNSSPVEPPDSGGPDSRITDSAPMHQNGAPSTQSNGHSLQMNGVGDVADSVDCTRTSGSNGQEENSKQVKQQPLNDEEDEDVREAKESIRGHLERMRETEKFIKSMHEEEDKFQKQRQDLIMFNNLLLSTKLSAINGLAANNKCMLDLESVGSGGAMMMGSRYTCYGGHTSYNGFKLDSTSNGHSFQLNSDQLYSNQHQPLVQNSPQQHAAEPFSSPMSCFSSDLYKPNSMGGGAHLSSPFYRTTSQFTPTMVCANSGVYSDAVASDPLLEPVKPLQSAYYNHSSTGSGRSWRRSKSQLGEQFSTDYVTPISGSNSCLQQVGCPSRRPLSANIDSITAGSRSYFPSRQRRSMSQIRHSVIGPQSPLDGSGDQLSGSSMMSEYKSSFGPNLTAGATRPSRSPARRATSPLFGPTHAAGPIDTEHDDSDDDEMRSYRASSYVPRVVPEGGPTYARGRSLIRRKSTLDLGKTCERRADLVATGSHPVERDQPEADGRRRSLQTMYSSLNQLKSDNQGEDCRRNGERSVSPALDRRRDSDGGEATRADCGLKSQSGAAVGRSDNSRLSELEQRIQANKRRREELLSEIKSGASLAELESNQTTDGASLAPRTRKISENCDRDADDGRGQDESLSFGLERPTSKSQSGSHRSTTGCSTNFEKSANQTRGLSATSRYSNGTSTSRPSRLESMEARIKRRSYCIKVSTSDISKTNRLERVDTSRKPVISDE